MSAVLTADLPSPDLSARFGLAVRELRRLRGWSQEDLAAEASLNRTYLGEVERGQVSPSLVTAAKLAQALAVPLAELLARAEPGPAPQAD